jgi:hypothetical protein
MDCNWAKDNLILYLYDELPDDARHELEQHLERCASCALELQSARQFHATMSTVPAADPNPNLLAGSRMKLQEALETAEQHRGWHRWTLDFAGWFHQVRFNPALAVILLMFGFAGGIMATWQLRQSPAVTTPAAIEPAHPAEASIAAIRAITQEPGDKVQIQYDTVQPRSIEGSLDNPKIQQMLLMAAQRNSNSGVRMDSIDLLSQKPGEEAVREALMSALRYDNNPGVRLKALDALGPYVKQDVRVRDAVLEALLSDSNPGVRAEAISLLQPCRADSSVRQVLNYLSRDDKSHYIRTESKRVLASIPEID